MFQNLIYTLKKGLTPPYPRSLFALLNYACVLAQNYRHGSYIFSVSVKLFEKSFLFTYVCYLSISRHGNLHICKGRVLIKNTLGGLKFCTLIEELFRPVRLFLLESLSPYLHSLSRAAKLQILS